MIEIGQRLWQNSYAVRAFLTCSYAQRCRNAWRRWIWRHWEWDRVWARVCTSWLAWWRVITPALASSFPLSLPRWRPSSLVSTEIL